MPRSASDYITTLQACSTDRSTPPGHGLWKDHFSNDCLCFLMGFNSFRWEVIPWDLNDQTCAQNLQGLAEKTTLDIENQKEIRSISKAQGAV